MLKRAVGRKGYKIHTIFSVAFLPGNG